VRFDAPCSRRRSQLVGTGVSAPRAGIDHEEASQARQRTRPERLPI
jgi:hypothetical protein